MPDVSTTVISNNSLYLFLIQEYPSDELHIQSRDTGGQAALLFISYFIRNMEPSPRIQNYCSIGSKTRIKHNQQGYSQYAR